ncbi:MAG: hypothetical protein LBT68_00940, partial [Spirochaetales bacterium]|nr:hypothetical protein [Spirochaetales bacterium]
MIDDPKLRVFHIDTECYIIYVGKNPNDYRPFLRVGNSRFLPERAKTLVSVVMITDSLTGNQLIEHENLQIPLTGETRYIGDPDEVAKLKQFLEDNEIPSESYEDDDDEDRPPEKSGAFVYFYKNGNMQLFHDKKRLFDLQDREKADGHFIYRVEKAVQAVKSNPFRYLPADLSPPGFFFSGENPFFFREGKIGTHGVSADYFRDMGKYGFDPDLLSWLVEDRISEGLLCRFKRATVTKKDIRVAALDLRKFQNAVSLFTSSGLSCIIAHLEPGEEKVFSGFVLRRRNTDLAVAFPETSAFPEVVFPGSAQVSAGRILNDLVKTLGIGGGEFHPIEGVPYRILDKIAEDAGAFIKTYLLDAASGLKDMEDAAGQELLKSLEALFLALVPRGAAAAKALSGGKYKNLGADAPEEISYLLWNIHEFARLCASRKGVSAGLMKNSGRLDSFVAIPAMPLKNATYLPVLGDLYKSDRDWYVFYRWNGVLTKLKLLQAQKSCESIEKLGVQDNESLYVSERQRLIGVIGGLMDPPARKKKPLPVESSVPGGAAAATAAPAPEKPVSGKPAGEKPAAGTGNKPGTPARAAAAGPARPGGVSNPAASVSRRQTDGFGTGGTDSGARST